MGWHSLEGKFYAHSSCFLASRRLARIILDYEDEWKSVRVEAVGGYRTLHIRDGRARLKEYDGEVRQIAITGHGKIKSALIITNDFATPPAQLIRTYTHRWLVEKEISEQIHFFRLNKPSSSIVIKVDFHLTMSIMAHNLYRLLALELPGYGACEAETLFNKFVDSGADIELEKDIVRVKLKKKRDLPLLLKVADTMPSTGIPWFGGRKLEFFGATVS